MIVPMKSVAVLGLASRTESILNELRDIGVVHVRHVKPPEGRSLEQLAEEIARATTALNLLPRPEAPTASSESGQALIGRLFELGEKKRALEEELSQLQRESARVDYLDDFQPEDVQDLGEKGVRIRLYECNSKQLAEIPSDVIYRIVGERDKKKVLAVVSYREEKALPFDESPIPSRSFTQVRVLIAERKEELSGIESEIHHLAPHRAVVKKTLVELENRYELEKVRAGTGAAAELVYVRGFCPLPELDKLRYAAERNCWGLAVTDPADDEEPPTLLENPKWVRLIDPVLRFIKTVPGYREFDISLWFLLFLSVFFAMLIGDAGYGAIFIVATASAQVKLGKRIRQKEPFYLMYVFGVGTLIWGALTGNWLGVEAIARLSPFKDMVVPSLNAFSTTSQNTVIHICFIIGAVQLSIGHLMVAVRYINSFKAVEQAGRIIMLWAAYFLARLLVLNHELPSFFMALLAFGAALILLSILADRQRRKRLFLSVYDLVMSSINAFADSMSYIRLFAVGMATLAVAKSFNEMAGQLGFGDVFRGFGSAVILFLGHALNIVLALMAVIVHGVRLNMLEFSGHVGNTWSGYEYSPFRKKSVD